MSHEPVPPALRAAVTADLAPVTPLGRPTRRGLELAIWAAALIVGVSVVFHLRRPAGIGAWLGSWGLALLEVGLGVGLAMLATRESIPAAGIGARRALGALLAAAAVMLVPALLLTGPSIDVAEGTWCFMRLSGLMAPATLWLLVAILGGLPLRPGWAGALAGGAAALVADGAWHLVCPIVSLDHLLVWHIGAGLASVALGAVACQLATAMRRR